jgi:hypothetical protein
MAFCMVNICDYYRMSRTSQLFELCSPMRKEAFPIAMRSADGYFSPREALYCPHLMYK